MSLFGRFVLGGSWVVISRVISRVAILITHIQGLTTPLITTHEPPSKGTCKGSQNGIGLKHFFLVGSFVKHGFRVWGFQEPRLSHTHTHIAKYLFRLFVSGTRGSSI